LVILVVIGNTEISSYLYRQQSKSVFSTLTGRTNEWSEADTLWKTAPIFGLGYYSGHREGLVEESLLQPGQGVPSNLDETWLETLVDVGVVGCVLLAGFALAGMTRLMRYRRRLPANVRWCALALGILVFPITSFVNPTIQANITPNFVVWGFLLLMFPSKLRPAVRPRPHIPLTPQSRITDRQGP
jgi:O-antigen ligase